jgi:hypothetical protein
VLLDILAHFPDFFSLEFVDIIEKSTTFSNSFSSFLLDKTSSNVSISSLLDNSIFLVFFSLIPFWIKENSDFKIDKFEL